jgi:regulator of protease activity HflC (stomatin/prohibitin superfamily)
MNPMFLLVGLAIVILFFIIVTTFRIVVDYKKLVILRLGTYAGTRGPGIVVVLPFLESATAVDMREKFLDIPAQTAITKDNASILIDFLVYYRITEPSLSILKVDNVERASANIATTTLRAVIGDIELDGVLSKREQINDILRVKLDEATERWGLKVTAVEIREIEPPKDILDAMNRQMKAEGERESAILAAEGEKLSQKLRAEGYSEALAAIHTSAATLDEKTMALQYMEMLSKVGSSPSTKFVIPMELVSFVEKFSGIAGMGNKS